MNNSEGEAVPDDQQFTITATAHVTGIALIS
jgi:hypothetical protein